ncbi:hypothetical protein EJD97_007413 [Solanum chilense]|uniref:Uncharacterized protein n=1 Tax=Solanum chilense TaxID=4083 RepID=A0A6N2AKD9_SOLCI|nr:hypothetical protein EJD97_007413 [Solanum chilense]
MSSAQPASSCGPTLKAFPGAMFLEKMSERSSRRHDLREIQRSSLGCLLEVGMLWKLLWINLLRNKSKKLKSNTIRLLLELIG